MHSMIGLRTKMSVALAAGVLLLASCGAPAASPQPPRLVAFAGTPTAQCAWEEVLPKIEKIQPTDIKVGTEVTVSASGGYLRDSCGGVNESARMYQVFFDDEPIADLSCYVNHCEGKFVL